MSTDQSSGKLGPECLCAGEAMEVDGRAEVSTVASGNAEASKAAAVIAAEEAGPHAGAPCGWRPLCKSHHTIFPVLQPQGTSRSVVALEQAHALSTRCTDTGQHGGGRRLMRFQ